MWDLGGFGCLVSWFFIFKRHDDGNIYTVYEWVEVVNCTYINLLLYMNNE